jgi:pimeloyl-ACP methyl ester carboxylesterase
MNTVSDDASENQQETGSGRRQSPRRHLHRLRRLLRVVLSLLAFYLVVVLMLHLLQRSFIYLPTRESGIEPQDAGLPPGQVHTVSIRADDGLELRGWHILADGRSAADRKECDRELTAGRRLVLFFSGNAANRRYRVPEFGILTSLGVDVFIFDYRGYGDNSGSPSEEKLAADARAIWNYATQECDVRPDRIILYGESLGGGVAVRLAAEMCEADTPPGGLILRSTFSSLVDAGKHHYPFLPVRLALVDRYPSVDRIPQVTCPILQFHGARDSIMPIKLGRRLFEAAPEKSSSGIAKQFVELPTAGHNDVTTVAEAELRAAIQQFLSSLDRQQ